MKSVVVVLLVFLLLPTSAWAVRIAGTELDLPDRLVNLEREFDWVAGADRDAGWPPFTLRNDTFDLNLTPSFRHQPAAVASAGKTRAPQASGGWPVLPDPLVIMNRDSDALQVAMSGGWLNAGAFGGCSAECSGLDVEATVSASSVVLAPVPVPASLLLLLSASGILGWFGWRAGNMTPKPERRSE